MHIFYHVNYNNSINHLEILHKTSRKKVPTWLAANELIIQVSACITSQISDGSEVEGGAEQEINIFFDKWT